MSGKRVLVVEDEFMDHVKGFLGRRKDKRDYMVDIATSYWSAIAMVRSIGYDGLITDCFFPAGNSEDGRQMAEEYYSHAFDEIEGGGCWEYMVGKLRFPGDRRRTKALFDENLTHDYTKKEGYFRFVRHIMEREPSDPMPLGPMLADRMGVPTVIATRSHHHEIEPVFILAANRGWWLLDCGEKDQDWFWDRVFRTLETQMERSK